LFEECARLNGFPKLTKQQLVDLLTTVEESPKKSSEEPIKNQNLSKRENVCELPKDVRFKIMSELHIGDLNNLCRLSKKCSEIFQKGRF